MSCVFENGWTGKRSIANMRFWKQIFVLFFFFRITTKILCFQKDTFLVNFLDCLLKCDAESKFLTCCIFSKEKKCKFQVVMLTIAITLPKCKYLDIYFNDGNVRYCRNIKHKSFFYLQQLPFANWLAIWHVSSSLQYSLWL